MTNNRKWTIGSLVAVGCMAMAISGCGKGSETPSSATTGGEPVASGDAVKGEIVIDGSSTVYPISEAVAEEFNKSNPDVKVSVGTSGTGGGFKKFTNGELDITGASRPIEDKEIEAAKAKGIEFIEIPIAFDGLSILANPANDFSTDISVDELKKIWMDGSTVQTWKDVNPAWPAEKIKLYGPGTDSGTFDYFTKAINGKEKSSRADYQASEDDNVLVTGVNGDKYSLGYFGYAYYETNKDRLKLVKVNGVAPSPETIANGTYTPLSRPLFWYVNKKSMDKPQVAAIVKFLLTQGSEFIASTNYIPLPAEAYTLNVKRVEDRTTGTLFKGAQSGMKIEDILKAESGK